MTRRGPIAYRTRLGSGTKLEEKIVIIGAGQAGAQAAASLRQAGFAGEVVLIGAEPEPPYQRPPLSKAYLEGALDKARLYLKPLDFYEKQAITLRLGAAVAAIDRMAKEIALDNGETLSYGKRLIAAGAESACRSCARP